MKKFFIAIQLLLISSVHAQPAVDTVNVDMPWYMTNPHGNIINDYCFSPYFTDGPVVGNSLYRFWHPKDTMEIAVYGVAVTAKDYIIQDDIDSGYVRYSPTVMIYSHVAPGNPPTVNFLDSANVLGIIKQCKFEYQMVDGGTRVVPCYEYYFDTPFYFHLPTDTFYISRYWPERRCVAYLYWRVDHPDFWMQEYGVGTDFEVTEPWGWVSNSGMFDFRETTPFNPHTPIGQCFPIINLRCMPPYIHTVSRGGDTATVAWWQAEEGEEYEVSLTSYGGNPDSGMIVTTADTFYTFTGLLPDTIYSAWVRKACRYTTSSYNTVVWSDWCRRPTVFRASVSGGGEDIGEVDAERLRVTTSDGCVVVQGLAAGEQAEVYDMKGSRVALLTADGRTAQLPQGVYMVHVEGFRARKVVVYCSGQ